MKKMFLGSFLFLFLMSGMAHASLTTIGTATYNGADYNLIWDDDNNGNSVVWLDYSNDKTTWYDQVAWAADLGDQLTINLDGYTVAWEDDAWRLPTTVDGRSITGYDGTTTAGYNITTSEIGHLYYSELGSLGYFNTSHERQDGYGLETTGDFENLIEDWYWSGTENAIVSDSNAWRFHTGVGSQWVSGKGEESYGIAVRSGQVSAVPVPGAVWLLGSGLTLAVLGRRKKGNRDSF